MAQHQLSRLADKDVGDIWLYIAADNPTAADRMIDRFTRAFDLLADNPEMGEAQEHLRPGLRRFVIGNYLIFYQPAAEGILIVRVLHGARRYESEFLG
jgi:toxin ParE1/3/4